MPKSPKLPKFPNAIKVDPAKRYPPLEAVTLAQATATNRFDGKIEAHLVVKSTGNLGGFMTERKAPLIHTVLGKQSDKPAKLAEVLTKMITGVGDSQITKLVVCATMGPSIKVDYQL